MAATIPRCPSCGRPISANGPILCPSCGAFTDRAPEAPPPEKGSVVILKGTTEDDGNPYTLRGRPIPRCPECDSRLPDDDAARCEQCGWDRAAGKRIPKTYSRIDRHWESGWSLQARAIAFAGCMAINIVTVIISLAFRNDPPVTIFGFFVAVGLQVFLIGTFDRLELTRTTKGKVTLVQQWRVAFWPLPPKTIRWREHEEIRVLHAEPSTFEYIMLLALIPTIIPAILWAWFVIRPGHAKTALCKDLGDPVTPLYLGTNMDRADEIAKDVSEATGLPWRPHGA